MLAAFQISYTIGESSAGIFKIHEWEAPNDRAQKVSKIRGSDISNQRAKQIPQKDSELTDIMLAMDVTHFRFLHQNLSA